MATRLARIYDIKYYILGKEAAEQTSVNASVKVKPVPALKPAWKATLLKPKRPSEELLRRVVRYAPLTHASGLSSAPRH